MLRTLENTIITHAPPSVRLFTCFAVALVVACSVSCVIVPIPFPSYSRETLKGGKLHVRDAETHAVLPEALILVVRQQQPGSTGYPVAFEREPILTVTNAYIFQDGDPVVTKSTRGVRYIFDIHVKASGSSTSGFLVAAAGYAPMFFDPPAAASSDETVYWNLTPEESNKSFAVLRDEIRAKAITLTRNPSAKAESQLSDGEEARSLQYFDRYLALAGRSSN